MRPNVWAMAFALVALVLAGIGVWQSDLTWSAAAIVAAVLAHAESS